MTLEQLRQIQSVLVASEYAEDRAYPCDSGCTYEACPLCKANENSEHEPDCGYPTALATIKAEIENQEALRQP